MRTRESEPMSVAERNVARFVAFRALFNARFYYPVLAVLFLDLGVTAGEYALLNFVWAVVIVVAEVPSGALADRFGRRPLVIAAALLMVAEMLALLLAPVNGGGWLLLLCLANRTLSGLAEAMASGADEALAYDALAAEARRGEWPNVMAAVMRWQSVGMVIAMLVGATVYDPQLMNRIAAALGVDYRFSAAATLRLPIALNLLSALIVVYLALGMREPARSGIPSASVWRGIVDAAICIWRSPVALFAIVGGVVIDSAIRVFLTFASVYYRLIDLPEASFGLVGAVLAGIGLLAAPAAHRLARDVSLLRNYLILVVLTLFGLLGVALRIPLWGVLFSLPLVAAMALLGFFVSNTLNAEVGSAHRATVLSFKGLLFNLGYGLSSLFFGLGLRALRDGGQDDLAFAQAVAALPLCLTLALLLLVFVFWRRRALLHARASSRSAADEARV